MTLEEQFLFCDPAFYRLFATLQACDSSSYFFFNMPDYVKSNQH